MLKILKITKTDEYKAISKDNEKFYSKTLILLRKNTPEEYLFNQKNGNNASEFCRVGYTASKKVGSAVVRNKAKRRLKEAARKIMPEMAESGYDYVIIAKAAIKEADFDKILSDLRFCVKRIGKKTLNSGVPTK